MTVYGADADELDRLAAEFRRAADELDREGGLMTQLLNNVAWIGDVAGKFVGGWAGIQLPRIALSTRFLREAADDLTRNATEQRESSQRHTGGIGPSPSTVGSTAGSRGLPSSAITEGLSWTLLGLGTAISDIAELSSGVANGTLTWDALLADGRGQSLMPGFEAGVVGEFGTAVQVLGTGWTGITAAFEGDNDIAIRSLIDLTWTGVGGRIPLIAAGKGAWDVGWMIGDGIYAVGDHFGVNDRVQDTIISDVIERDFGGEVPHDFGKRYDGWGGFGRFVTDAGKSGLGRLKFW